MRRSLIAIAATASALSIGLAGGLAGASGHPDSPPPTDPSFDLDEVMSQLGPEQLGCLITNIGALDTNDLSGIMDLMSQCGIDLMDLVSGDSGAEPGVVTETAPPVPLTGALESAAAVLAVLGVDATSAQCIEDGLFAAASPGDDNEALAILQSCGLTLNDLLIGIVAVNDAASGASSDVFGPDDTAMSTESDIASDNPFVAELQQMLEDDYGITLTSEQSACLLDNVGSLDTADIGATLQVMEDCGITLADLG